MKVLLDMLEEDIGKNEMYQRHNDDLIIIEKIHAFEFISRLIIHVPDYNFKQIRLYGAYHNSTILKIDAIKLLTKEKADYKIKLNNWHSLILLSFKSDPLNCPVCKNTMIYYNSIYTRYKKKKLKSF